MDIPSRLRLADRTLLHLCLHFSALCPCYPSCLPLGPRGSLSLLRPLKGMRERESDELSASRWVTSFSLRGNLAWILPTPQFSQVKNEDEVAYSEGCAGCLGVAKLAAPSPLSGQVALRPSHRHR